MLARFSESEAELAQTLAAMRRDELLLLCLQTFAFSKIKHGGASAPEVTWKIKFALDSRFAITLFCGPQPPSIIQSSSNSGPRPSPTIILSYHPVVIKFGSVAGYRPCPSLSS